MDIQLKLTLLILLGTVLLFAFDKLKLELVALLSLLALMVSKVVTTQEALAGFSNPIVLMIGALFVVGGGLMQTGVADSLGQILGDLVGKHPSLLITLLMAMVALLSAFMSSTGTVAIFMPVTMSLAVKLKLSPSQFLIPLSFASLIGGMLTLIGTPPNIVVSNELVKHGLEPFHFFDFTFLGGILLITGIAYIVLVGHRLLPQGGTIDTFDEFEVEQLLDNYGVSDNLFSLQVKQPSLLTHAPLKELDLVEQHQVMILSTKHFSDLAQGAKIELAGPETRIKVNDILMVEGSVEAIEGFAHQYDLTPVEQREKPELLNSDHNGLVEVLLTPRSKLLGKSVAETHFRDKYGLHVLSVRRMGKKIPNHAKSPLNFSDLLLVYGSWQKIKLLHLEKRDFVVVCDPKSLRKPNQFSLKQLQAVVIVLLMLLGMGFNLLEPVTIILTAAVLMILMGCLTMEEAYRSISWGSLILIACLLPMATALQKTGGIDYVSQGLVYFLGDWGTLMILMSLFLITSTLSQFMSNTATTVLLAPVAFQLALSLNHSPQAFLMTVAIAASSAFATPVASPTNTMVLGPGNYRFMDFVKVGVPLQFLFMLITVWILPWLFPL